MQTVSGKIIERTWKRVNEATPEDLQALQDRMIAAQPFVAAFLLAVEETLMDESERGQLLLLGMIMWDVLESAGGPLRVVKQADIEQAEAANVQFLEKLEAGSEMDYFDALQRLLTQYNQAPLLSAVVEGLMEDNGEEPDTTPDSVGIALLHLKTVLDCLDQ